MAGSGLAESYDWVVLTALLTLPGLLDDLDAEHAGDQAGECVACSQEGDGDPAGRCVLRLSIEQAKRIRAVRRG